MDKKTFLRLSVVFSAVYFFSTNGLAALPNLSLSFLLKDNLHLSAAGLAYFQAVTILAWVVKPVWGYISDSFPIFGYRRKSYLILASCFAGFSWILLGVTHQYTVSFLLSVVTISYMAYAFQDVVADGLMVEKGKPEGLTGKFQAIQWTAVYAAMIVSSILGGKLAQLIQNGKLTNQMLFIGCSIFPFIIAIISFFFIQEDKTYREEKIRVNVRETFFRKDLLILAAFLFFWKFSPSINAPFFYYAVDTLKFTPEFIGNLQATAAIGGLIGSMLFGKFFANVSIRKLLVFSVLISTAMTLLDYVYFVPEFVANPEGLKMYTMVTRIPFGIIETLIFLTMLNLAAKVSPVYAGGAIFAFLTSASNLGMMGSSVLGGVLFQAIGLSPLVLVSAGFTLLGFLFLPFLSIEEPLTAPERMIKRIFSSKKS